MDWEEMLMCLMRFDMARLLCLALIGWGACVAISFLFWLQVESVPCVRSSRSFWTRSPSSRPASSLQLFVVMDVPVVLGRRRR